MKDSLQFKSFEIKAYKEAEDNFTIEGYGAVFNNVDSYKDVIEKGAFAKTINERGGRIAFCLQHNIHEPIGKITEIKEDGTGLFIKCQISKSEPSIITKIKEGIFKEMSIGYNTINSKAETIEGQEVNKLTEIKLYEISLVTIAANPLAIISGMKSEEANEYLKEEFSRLIKLTRSSEIKFELMKIQGQVKALIEGIEPGNPTPPPEPEPRKSEIELKTFKF